MCLTQPYPLVRSIWPKIDSTFGVRPYDWQAEAIDASCDGRDVILIKSTGGGKSLPIQALCLQKPGGIVLVIAPTNAIMYEQVSPSVFNTNTIG
jgi:superfamily II DNA helicase RecQ